MPKEKDVKMKMLYTENEGSGPCGLFLVQPMLPESILFHQFNITYYSCCLVPVWRL